MGFKYYEENINDNADSVQKDRLLTTYFRYGKAFKTDYNKIKKEKLY